MGSSVNTVLAIVIFATVLNICYAQVRNAFASASERLTAPVCTCAVCQLTISIFKIAHVYPQLGQTQSTPAWLEFTIAWT